MYERPGRLRRIGDYYWSSVRGVVRMVRGVPPWPAPARRAAQAALVVLGVLFVLVSWVYKTLVAVLKVVAGQASAGRSPSGPTKFPTGNG